MPKIIIRTSGKINTVDSAASTTGATNPGTIRLASKDLDISLGQSLA